MPISPDLRAFAEAPDRFTQLGPDVERSADARRCVVQGPSWAAVSDVHVAGDEVEGLVAELRTLVPAAKQAVWWIGPSSEPADLIERLEALGFTEPADRAPVLHALACTVAPPAVSGVDVRRVETIEDFVTARDLGWETFAIPQERRDLEAAHLEELADAALHRGGPLGFLAFLDGEPVGVGRSVLSPRGVFLIGGAVLPAARGRGAYRALVRARWDDAVERGTPAMITEALPDTSYPILKRLGFEEVCTIRRLGAPR